MNIQTNFKQNDQNQITTPGKFLEQFWASDFVFTDQNNVLVQFLFFFNCLNWVFKKREKVFGK